MSRIDVNLNEVEVPSGEPHPEGDIHVRVRKAEFRKAKEDGKYPHILFQMEPIGTENKSHLFLRCSLHPNAQWNLKLLLEALGVAWDSDGSFDTEDTLGQETMVHVTVSDYQGRPSNEVGPPYHRVAV